MKTVHFKNGSTIEITQKVANILMQNITKGCGNFQCFSDENNQVDFIINLSEVVKIQ